MASSVLPQETTMNLRLDPVLKADFVAAVGERSAAEVMRELMRQFVAAEKQRTFLAEARCQSQRIAASEEEDEVMRWIQDVSDPECQEAAQ